MTVQSDKILTHVMEVAADVFGVPPSQVAPDSSPDTVEAWDSISHLNLMLAVEQSTGVRIEPEAMAELTSITKIAEAVRVRLP